MKYSIRGNLLIADGSDVVSLLNEYNLWQLITSQSKNINNNDIFAFEVWVNTLEDKNSLFNRLKMFVDEYGEFIDWHECTHDEQEHNPCSIFETYMSSR